MIIEFSVGNYRSFDKVQTLSFRATKLDSPDETVDQGNILTQEDQRLLKIVGVYGANASGKTNLIEALAYFQVMVGFSVPMQGYSTVGVKPFRQSLKGKQSPSYFQIVLLLSGKKYRYGLTLENNGNIGSEWLFGPADKNETFYFKRTPNKIEKNAEWFKEGTSLPEDNLRPDALFLSFCSSYNGPISKKVSKYLVGRVKIEAMGRQRKGSVNLFFSPFTGQPAFTNQLLELGNKELVLTWLKEVGLIYNNIRLQERTAETSEKVYLSKNIFDETGNIEGETEMELAEESEGTNKFYSYIGILIGIFQSGGIYICDEIDGNFHPSLLLKIIRLFQNPVINKAGAQLLFTSHDTNLMDPGIMRRDQFYFCEKNMSDATQLYSLADLKGIRNNADFARQYLAGFYGALPMLGNYLEETQESEI